MRLSFVLLAAVACARSVLAGAWVDESYTNGFGTRAFRFYVPDGYTAGEARPLLVGIHGCTETPVDFAGLTRIAKLADENRLLVLLPAQSTSENASNCWNWFLPVNQSRNSGEPSIIIGMVDWAKGHYTVDQTRIYAFGVSSGGYTTSTMLSCYGDVFAAGMVASGGMYEGAGDVFSATFTALFGSLRDPNVAGSDAYRCAGSVHPRRVPVLVFHGNEDAVVAPVNGEQVIAAFAQLNDLGDDGIDNNSVTNTPTGAHTVLVAGGLSYEWTDYTFGAHYVVKGMAHKWSGGDPAFQYAETRGPDETAIMWEFLKKHQRLTGPQPRRRATR